MCRWEFDTLIDRKFEKFSTFTCITIATLAKIKVFRRKRGNGCIDGQLHKEKSFSRLIPSTNGLTVFDIADHLSRRFQKTNSGAKF